VRTNRHGDSREYLQRSGRSRWKAFKCGVAMEGDVPSALVRMLDVSKPGARFRGRKKLRLKRPEPSRRIREKRQIYEITSRGEFGGGRRSGGLAHSFRTSTNWVCRLGRAGKIAEEPPPVKRAGREGEG